MYLISRGQCSSFYTNMEIISRLSAHASQNHNVCLGAHGRLPGTLQYDNYGTLQGCLTAQVLEIGKHGQTRYTRFLESKIPSRHSLKNIYKVYVPVQRECLQEPLTFQRSVLA